MSHTQDILDRDADLWLTEVNYPDCVKRAEVDLSPSEKRGRYLAAQAAHAETDVHPALPAEPEYDYRPYLCAFSLVMAALTILFFGILLGNMFFLPEATAWPLGIVTQICATVSAVLGWFGLRGEQ